jgi:dCMP deaminase
MTTDSFPSLSSSYSSPSSTNTKRVAVLSLFESLPSQNNGKTRSDDDVVVVDDDGPKSESDVVPPSLKRIKADQKNRNNSSSSNEEKTSSTESIHLLLPHKIPIAKYLLSQRLFPATQNKDYVDHDDDDDCREDTASAAPMTAVGGGDDGVIVVTPKRHGYLDWDDYFLGIAILSSKRSKDPDHAEGACIVDQHNRIVAIGYSGFPRGCPDTVFPWVDVKTNRNKNRDGVEDDQHTIYTHKTTTWLHSKQPYLCPAITNAILNKCSEDVAGCRLYAMEFPSSDCVKVMIQSGIRELIILKPTTTSNNDTTTKDGSSTHGSGGGNVLAWTDDEQASWIMLEMAQIHVRYHQPALPSLILDFGISNETTTPHQDTDTLYRTPTARTISTTSHTAVVSNLDYTMEEQKAIDILKLEAEYDATTVADNGRRKDYLTWDDYFMSVAFLTAQRSKDPNTQVGACIVDDEHRIIGLGYNGMPRGLSDDAMPWARDTSNPSIFTKYPYVTHAEVNAILNKGSANVKGSTIYVALFPCENCAKMIIQSGIRRVVFLSDRYHNTDGCRASRIMLKCANVELVQYTPSQCQMTITYDGTMSI